MQVCILIFDVLFGGREFGSKSETLISDNDDRRNP